MIKLMTKIMTKRLIKSLTNILTKMLDNMATKMISKMMTNKLTMMLTNLFPTSNKKNSFTILTTFTLLLQGVASLHIKLNYNKPFLKLWELGYHRKFLMPVILAHLAHYLS